MSERDTKIIKKVAVSAIFIAIGLVLAIPNPFIYIQILGAKIFPFAHMINAITGVLLGLFFSTSTALGIATLRFFLALGSAYAFPGHLSGAIVVGLIAYYLQKRNPKRIDLAALSEPIGTIFLGATIAYLIGPLIGLSPSWNIILLFGYWGSWALSCIPGAVLGYVILKTLRKAGISRRF
jgi:energy coupling factor transporter S component ThiW